VVGGSFDFQASDGDRLVAAFARWVAAEQVAQAAAGRARKRSLAEQAASGATVAGVLVDLAEGGAAVTLASGDFRLNGHLVGVGSDFCVVDQAGGRPALVATSAIAAVWPGPSAGVDIAGDRAPALQLSFTGALALLAEDRVPVRLRVGSLTVEGDLVRVGDQVLTLRGPPPGRRPLYVPCAGVQVCEIR
jgi:hypothetical protein